MRHELRLSHLRYRGCFTKTPQPHPRTLVVGVDRGGTWIRVKLFDARLRCLRSFRGTSPTLEKLPALLARLFKQWTISPTHLAVASRGVWKPAQRKALERSLRHLAPSVLALSDVEAGWLDAFGLRQPLGGILLISGTGSIAYGRNAKGKSARAGGLGPERGDEGSGFWIGDQWASSPRPLNPMRVRRTAQKTYFVFKQAAAENLRARHILWEAQMHLADLIQELRKRLSWTKTLPFAFSGSVLEVAPFRKGVVQELKRRRIAIQVVVLRRDAATAAAGAIIALPPYGHH